VRSGSRSPARARTGCGCSRVEPGGHAVAAVVAAREDVLRSSRSPSLNRPPPGRGVFPEKVQLVTTSNPASPASPPPRSPARLPAKVELTTVTAPPRFEIAPPSSAASLSTKVTPRTARSPRFDTPPPSTPQPSATVRWRSATRAPRATRNTGETATAAHRDPGGGPQPVRDGPVDGQDPGQLGQLASQGDGLRVGETSGSKVMASAPARALASRIACRREPGPESAASSPPERPPSPRQP